MTKTSPARRTKEDRTPSTINLTLHPDQAEAFAASLRYFFGDDGEAPNVAGFLERCVDNLIEAAAKGEFLVSPNFLHTVEG
jgi:hypothetical protein